MGGIRWAVLSPETVRIDDAPVALANRSRQVLLRLLLEPNTVVSADQLADALWVDDQLPKSPRNSVARFVSDVRRSLGTAGERIATTSGSYRLRVEPGELDIEILETALSAVEAELAGIEPGKGKPGENSKTDELRDTVEDVGVGPNHRFDGLYGIEAILRSHEELRTGALEILARAFSRQGRYRQAISLLERSLAVYPYHEQFLRLLVRTLNAAGRPHDAAVASERLAQLLAEIGIVDDVVLRSDLGANAAGPEPFASSVTAPWPDERYGDDTPLIGRIDDVRAVQRLLARHRFVTIVGLGGTGKTRLASAVSQASSATAPVYRLDLRTVEDPQVVVSLAATALGMPPTSGLDASGLAERIAAHRLTLVIDNCEHLRDAVAALVSALLERAPDVRMLTTSRQSLGAPEEHTYVLSPLAIGAPTSAADSADPVDPAATSLTIGRSGAAQDPGPPSDAAELFLVRTNGRLGASPPRQELDLVEAICRHLNGLPLAIEIAAAQLSIMTLEQLAFRTAPPLAPTHAAQRFVEPAVTAVNDALDWAWQNLTADQKALLARLSTFAGGWTLSAAQAVRAARETLPADLDRLVSLSLVQVVRAPSTELRSSERELRYSMLVPVRDYAAARLDDRQETVVMRDRLAAWAIALTSQWSFPEHHVFSGPNDELEPEHANLLAAMTHLESVGRIEELVQLASGSSGMMVNRGLAASLIYRLAPHVTNEAVAPELRGEALFGLGAAHHAVGNLDVLAEIGQTCIELADGNSHDWVPVMAGYTSVWSLVAPVGHTTDELSAMAFDAAEHSATRQLNLGLASLYRAHIEFVSRNYDEALRLFRDAEALIQRPGRGLLVTEIGISLSLYMQGLLEEARTSTSRWQSRSDTDHWHYILEVVRAIVVGGAGDRNDALEATGVLSESVRSLPEAGAWGRAGIIQTAFAMLADSRGEPDLATELFASAVNRDILLIAVAISHVMQTRGVTGDEAWLEVGIEFWTRVVPPESVAATATSTPQLLSWWSSGDASPRT